MNDQSRQSGSWWSRFLLLLARTGTLRFGAKSWVYTSGRDRPLESVFPDVFDAARDVPHIHELGAKRPQNDPPKSG